MERDPLGSLTITIDTGAPIPERRAHQLGQDVAARIGGKPAGTVTEDADDQRIQWVVPIQAGPAATLGQYVADLEDAANDVLADAGWTGCRVLAITVTTGHELARLASRSNMPDVIGTDDFAKLLDVVPSRLYQLKNDDPRFPQALARGVYLRPMAEHYATSRKGPMTVTFPSADHAAYIVDTLRPHGHAVEFDVDGGTVTVDLTAAVLAVLADLPDDYDGHYDGDHIWIGGTEYPVRKP